MSAVHLKPLAIANCNKSQKLQVSHHVLHQGVNTRTVHIKTNSRILSENKRAKEAQRNRDRLRLFLLYP